MTLLLCLLCLLLCGCAQEAIPPEPTAAITDSTYDLTALLDTRYRDHQQACSLPVQEGQGLLSLGEDILVFSGSDITTLTLLSGDDLTVCASLTLDFLLSPQDPSLRTHESGLSFYDPIRQTTLILNSALQEVSHIYMTEPIQGSPILSQDQKTLYYATDRAILARDLVTGIHRTIKELHYDHQALTGLHLEDSVLQCRIQDGESVHTLFLDAATGQQRFQKQGDLTLTTCHGRYYTILTIGGLDLPIFGQTGGEPQILYAEASSTIHSFLPQSHAAITSTLDPSGQSTLTWYDLYTGSPTAALPLGPQEMLKDALATASGKVYLLTHTHAGDCDVLYRWDPAAPVFAVETAPVSTAPYPQTPESLDQCQEYAARLSEIYGITIHIGEDAIVVQPWDYCLEAETLPRILMQELVLLEERLAQYPKTILEQTRSHFSSLNLSLVRQITGSPTSGSLDTATGIQFLEGQDAHVVIAVGKYSQQALYHELYHVMETHILNGSGAMDLWNEWNPTGFVYSFSSQPPEGWDSCLTGENRAFIDHYAMTFPKEDRARIFESAMLPGNADLFRSPILQKKLTAQCHAIRQAYRLKKSAEAFPWEQYLDVPLCYQTSSQ